MREFLRRAGNGQVSIPALLAKAVLQQFRYRPAARDFRRANSMYPKSTRLYRHLPLISLREIRTPTNIA